VLYLAVCSMLCRGGRHGSVRTSKTPAAKKFPRLHHKEYRQGNFSIYAPF
jgi:hypothetical protein